MNTDISQWQGMPVRVTARQVPRYFWTTASIDVLLGDRCILSTGGQLKLTGSYSGTFNYSGSDHLAELSWGHSRFFRFPYQLRIDGMAVSNSLVLVENWFMIGIPSSVLAGIMVGFLGFVMWAMATLRGQ